MKTMQLQQRCHRRKEGGWLAPFMAHAALVKVDLVELEHLLEASPFRRAEHRHVPPLLLILTVFFWIARLLQDEFCWWFIWGPDLLRHHVQGQVAKEQDAVSVDLLPVCHGEGRQSIRPFLTSHLPRTPISLTSQSAHCSARRTSKKHTQLARCCKGQDVGVDLRVHQVGRASTLKINAQDFRCGCAQLPFPKLSVATREDVHDDVLRFGQPLSFSPVPR